MSDDVSGSPEARLIEASREELRPRLSARRAAELSGISEGRWRQIVKGFQQVTKDVRVPVRAPAETLARMANTVGVTPEQLRDVDRNDAAAELDLLRERIASEGAQVAAAPPGSVKAINSMVLRQIDLMIHLPMDIDDADLEKLRDLRNEVSLLPEVLGPIVDTPEGGVQHTEQAGMLLEEAQRILERYTDSLFPEDHRLYSKNRARLFGGNRGGEDGDGESHAMSIQFGDGGSVVMPYKIFGAIEREVERLATDPEALDNISLANIADWQTLAHYVAVKNLGYICVFASESGAKSFAQHFPDVTLPSGFFTAARIFLQRTKEVNSRSGFVMGPVDVGVGIAEKVYSGDMSTPDINGLLPEEQSGVLLQQFMVFALVVQYARGAFAV